MLPYITLTNYGFDSFLFLMPRSEWIITLIASRINILNSYIILFLQMQVVKYVDSRKNKLNDKMKFVHSLSLILLNYYKIISWHSMLRSLQRYNKVKSKKCNMVGTVLKSKRNIVRTETTFISYLTSHFRCLGNAFNKEWWC